MSETNIGAVPFTNFPSFTPNTFAAMGQPQTPEYGIFKSMFTVPPNNSPSQSPATFDGSHAYSNSFMPQPDSSPCMNSGCYTLPSGVIFFLGIFSINFHGLRWKSIRKLKNFTHFDQILPIKYYSNGDQLSFSDQSR
ncbi:unnamed protein product [Anisakis simplex]|uniref:Uncharacterized protein n=1 Tax=Anisakis simplex TaxID=6269 RepID=A0A3P6P1H4_ANISI|nr:unnamed protein product [Anisakis simplex]